MGAPICHRVLVGNCTRTICRSSAGTSGSYPGKATNSRLYATVLVVTLGRESLCTALGFSEGYSLFMAIASGACTGVLAQVQHAPGVFAAFCCQCVLSGPWRAWCLQKEQSGNGKKTCHEPGNA